MRAYLAFVALVGILCSVQVHGQKRKQCVKDGKTFVGSYVTDDCRQKCRCTKGKVKCKLLCPSRKRLTCRSDEEVSETKKYKGKNRKCYCLARKCVKKGDVLVPGVNGCLGPDNLPYPAGKDFIPKNCHENCRCSRDLSRAECVPLCPLTSVDCGPGEKQETYDRPVPNSSCTCVTKRCAKKIVFYASAEVKGCIGPDNITHPAGELFIPKTCEGFCRCSPDLATYECTPLCPLVNPACGPYETDRYTDIPVPDSECYCPLKQCVKKAPELLPDSTGCIGPDNTTYSLGERFIPKNCYGQCTCDVDLSGVTCSSLCPYIPTVCNEDETPKQYMEPIPNTDCGCPVTQCVKNAPVPPEPTETCLFKGVRYPINEKFIPKDCSGVCSCEGEGRIGCVSLCPPMHVACEPGMKKEKYKEPKPDSDCSCDRTRCVPEQ